MRFLRTVLLASCGALLVAANSCLFTDLHRQCHRKALAELGCCPFHGEECGGASIESIREACEEELEAAEPESAFETSGDTGSETGSSGGPTP